MVDRVTTARLRADAGQFMREMAKATAAVKAFDESFGSGRISTAADKELTKVSKSAKALKKDADDATGSLTGLSRELAVTGRSAQAFNRNLGNDEIAEWHLEVDRAAESTAKFDSVMDDSARSAAALNKHLGNDEVADWRIDMDAATRSAIAFNKAMAPLRGAQGLESFRFDPGPKPEMSQSRSLALMTQAAWNDAARKVRESSVALEDWGDNLSDADRLLRGTTDHVDRFNAALLKAGGGMRNNGKHLSMWGLDFGNAENRMQTITQALLAIGPAAVPALAAVGAGLTALAGTLTFAAAAAGGAVLAFTGVGDAVKALNEAAIDPSTANLEKLKLAMDELGPAAQNFSRFLNDVRGNLDVLQNVAAEGMFPGLQTAIESLIGQMPLFKKVVANVTGALGELFQQGGEAIDSDRFRSFFEYLATDANQILTGMGRTLGNFIAGFASVIQAFGPITQDFVRGLENMSQTFSAWAADLGNSLGFREFVDYIETNVPKLLDTLASLGEALVALAQAAAPFSGIALDTFRAMFEVLSTFLSTPLATPLIALASALGLVSTLLRIGKWAGGVALVKMFQKIPVAAASATIAMARFNLTVGQTAGLMAKGFIKSDAFKHAAAGIALFALALSDLDEQMGVSNTLNFAAMGAFFGGWGAVAGAAAGQTLDLYAAITKLNDAVGATQDVAKNDPGNLIGLAEGLDGVTESANGLREVSGFFGVGGFGALQFWAGHQEEEVETAKQQLEDMKVALTDLESVGRGPVEVFEDIGDFQVAADQIAPVLEHMGASFHDFREASLAGGSAWSGFVNNMRSARQEMDSLAGRSDTVVKAVSDLDNVFIDAGTSADTLATALESLVSPFLDLVAARDEFSLGLKTLSKDLASTRGSLFADTKAAIQNREVISNLTRSYIGIAEAEAKAGKGSLAVTRSLAANREALIKAGTAAGIARKDMERFADQAGLTPELVQTLFDAQGITQAEDEARNLADAYNKLPKQVRIAIKQEGVPKSEAELDRLQRKFKLNPKQLQTVIDVRDNGSIKVKGLNAVLDKFSRKEARATADLNTGPFTAKAERALGLVGKIDKSKGKALVDADASLAEKEIKEADAALKVWDKSEGQATVDATDHASLKISDAMRQLIAFDNYTATATITTVNRTVTPDRSATGGIVTGPGGPTSDTAGLFALSNREFVSRAASVEHYGADFYYALNSLKADRNALRRAIGLAGGGQVGRAPFPGLAGGGKPPRQRGDKLTALDVFMKTLREPLLTLEDIGRALHEMRDEARDVIVAERELRREREQSKAADRRLAEAEKSKGGASKQLREEQKQQAKDLEQAEKALSKQRDELSKATSKLKQQEQALLQQAQAISDAVTAQGEIFGGSGTSVTAGGILAKLRHAAKDAQQFKQDIAALRARGLDESLIQQLLEQGSTPEGVQAVHSLATASKAMLARINRQQGKLERVGAAVGALGVQSGGGNVIVNINGDIKTTDVDRLAKLLPQHIRKALRIASSP